MSGQPQAIRYRWVQLALAWPFAMHAATAACALLLLQLLLLQLRMQEQAHA
jgi:hypothetical protein